MDKLLNNFNNISLNEKKISFDIKIKIHSKKLLPCESVKYLGIYIDHHLNWKTHETTVSTKICRALGMLSKVRYFVDHQTLIMIYYGIFSSILMYSSLIWGHNNSIVTRLQILQNKALRIINFKPRRTSATPLYGKCKILKLRDYNWPSKLSIQYNTIQYNTYIGI